MMPEQPMQWPGLRRKLWPITIVRVPAWGWHGGAGGVEHFGIWAFAHVGPWLILLGSGTYPDAPDA